MTATPRESTDANGFQAALAAIDGVEGWLSADQALRLWSAAATVIAPGRILEIGSYRGRSAVVLATAAAPGVEVVAVDPHSGNDRGPRQLKGRSEDGQADLDAFHANLNAAGVGERVRHVRLPSSEAHDAVDGPVDLLYVDGAHRFRLARDDIDRWGNRVRPGGTMLVHDAFASVGVTLAQLTCLFAGSGFRYVGRSRSLAEYRREPLSARTRVENAARQTAELPWFLRNLAVKAALVLRLSRVARVLGHREGPWPY
jgi:predicted O-methyltransferase YrrM